MIFLDFTSLLVDLIGSIFSMTRDTLFAYNREVAIRCVRLPIQTIVLNLESSTKQFYQTEANQFMSLK